MSFLRALASRWPYFVIAGVVLFLDQVTKVLAHAHLRGVSVVEIVPGFFNLTYSRNRGGLFGYFSNLADPWRTVLLTLLPLVAIGLITLFIVRSDDTHRPTRIGLGLILGGAVGNLIDRLFRGEVVDFLDVYASSESLADWLVRTFGTAHWPTFNIADSAIVVGAGLLILDLFRPEPSAEQASPESTAGVPGRPDAG
jgi:signal peptidase II